MTSQQAQSVAQELGDILPNDEKLQAEIHRLNRKSFIPLEQVKMLHDWLDGKRQSRLGLKFRRCGLMVGVIGVFYRLGRW